MTIHKHITVVTLAAALTLVTTITACTDKNTEPFKDAPRGDVNDTPADVLRMPDGFSNVAAKCDKGNKVYVAYKGDENRASIAVVPNDPSCTGSQ